MKRFSFIASFAALMITLLFSSGCKRVKTCQCFSGASYEIIDSTYTGAIPDNCYLFSFETTSECSNWSSYDTLGHPYDEWFIEHNYVDCSEIETTKK